MIFLFNGKEDQKKYNWRMCRKMGNKEEMKIETTEGKEIVNFNEVVETKLKEVKDLDLQTALLLGIYRNFHPVVQEQVPEPEKTEEEQEKEDLQTELKVLKDNLENLKLREEGGQKVYGGRKFTVLSISKELRRLNLEIKQMELEMVHAKPLNPEYEFQSLPEWREVTHELAKIRPDNGLFAKQKTRDMLLEEKEQMAKTKVKYQKRMNEVEDKLGLKKTLFVNTK